MRVLGGEVFAFKKTNQKVGEGLSTLDRTAYKYSGLVGFDFRLPAVPVDKFRKVIHSFGDLVLRT